MRSVLKAVLLNMSMLIALVIASPWASAQTPVEFLEEENGLHCPAVVVNSHGVSGGCLVHWTSEAPTVLRQHVFGVESTVSTCAEEAYWRMGENGEGYEVNQVLSGAGCTREPCNEEASGGAMDPAHLRLVEVNGSEKYERSACYTPVGTHTQTSCSVLVPIQNSQEHTWEVAGPPEMPGIGPNGFRCELIMHLVSEPTTGFELIHL